MKLQESAKYRNPYSNNRVWPTQKYMYQKKKIYTWIYIFLVPCALMPWLLGTANWQIPYLVVYGPHKELNDKRITWCLLIVDLADTCGATKPRRLCTHVAILVYDCVCTGGGGWGWTWGLWAVWLTTVGVSSGYSYRLSCYKTPVVALRVWYYDRIPAVSHGENEAYSLFPGCNRE